MYITSFSLTWYLVDAESKTSKQSVEHEPRQVSELCRCLNTLEDLSNDSFCLFHSEWDANLFFDFINGQHPCNIHFTIEKEVNYVLPFLDVLMDNKTHKKERLIREGGGRGGLSLFVPFTLGPPAKGPSIRLIEGSVKRPQ